jgi:hypothetical protein
MKILVVEGDNDDIHNVTEYFDFNRISYTRIDTWEESNQIKAHTLNHPMLQQEDTLFVIDYTTFFSLCSRPDSLQQLIGFCKNNKIWVWAKFDGLILILQQCYLLTKLDSYTESANIALFMVGELPAHHSLAHLRNIKIKTIPCNFLICSPRIQNAKINKHGCSRDFMLTTVKRPERPHRDILWNQLNAIDGLSARGHVNYGTGKNRIGAQAHQHHWSDGHPSMDLYNDSWIEIVPETLYRDGYFMTEKIAKPIATKTPFLIVSSRFYLEYLRQQGFQTFSNIIDEKYDRQPLVEDRIRLMLVQLQDIIKNGSEEFYKECAAVLKHNQNRLFEIDGRKQYELDIFIAENLEKAGIK